MELSRSFWSNQRVLITGHTGFKGSWLSLLIHRAGGSLLGYSLAAPSDINLYEQANISELFEFETKANLTDFELLRKFINKTKPTVLIHLAAQPLVLEGYRDPITTYNSNVVGTLNVLEASRSSESLKSVVIITTDKVYENVDHTDGYKETDRLGGKDPYSSSKACVEILTDSYQKSFFKENHPVQIATARAGNVIGGGDWATNRLIPDCVRAFQKKEPIVLRQPHSIRPWQHVLEPLCGYMMLAERLTGDSAMDLAWNFGPLREDELTTDQVANIAAELWGDGSLVEKTHGTSEYYETNTLRLDSYKARHNLFWHPKWNAKQAIEMTVNWYRNFYDMPGSARELCEKQIRSYFKSSDQ